MNLYVRVNKANQVYFPTSSPVCKFISVWIRSTGKCSSLLLHRREFIPSKTLILSFNNAVYLLSWEKDVKMPVLSLLIVFLAGLHLSNCMNNWSVADLSILSILSVA